MKEKNPRIGCRFYSTLLSILFFVSMFLVVSCSGLSDRKSLIESEAPQAQMETVPKAQYDELLSKYQKLLRTNAWDDDKVEQQATEGSLTGAPDGDSNDMNTIDVYAEKSLPTLGGAKGNHILNYVQPVPSQVEAEITKFRNAEQLVSEKKIDQAVLLLKEVEKSKVLTIRVHAKYLMGEIFFMQQEFDLAMQVYEEIVRRYGSSSLAYEALKKLIVCLEKLQIREQAAEYKKLLSQFN